MKRKKYFACSFFLAGLILASCGSNEPPHTHTWNVIEYFWSEDRSTCTASAVCKDDDSHLVTETVNTTYEVISNAKCDVDGEGKYTATFTKEPFVTQYERKIIPQTGHDWGEPSYEWTDDYTLCTAYRVCKTDETHIDSEMARASIVVNKEADCENNGEETYTATFNNPYFETQTYVKTIPAHHDWGEPTYTWSKSYGTCEAVVRCKKDASHVNRIVSFSTSRVIKEATCEEDGLIEYTAEFTADYLETQIIEVTVDALGHDSEVTYEWSDDGTKCTAYYVCHNDNSHNETFTVDAYVTLSKDATCEEDGFIIYTADFSDCGNYHVVGDSKKIILPALGHEYSVSYEWNDDYSKCTATAACAHGHSYQVTNSSTYEVITPATSEAEGVGRYTVTFKDPLFETQTHDVAIPYVSVPGATPVLDEENNQISYGYYPQTRVTDSALIRNLNSYAELDSETGFYKWEGDYYSKVSAVKANNTTKFTDGTTITSGNIYFFKVEPIVWDILKVENNRYTLLADRVLCAKRYNVYYEDLRDGHYANNYKESEIRQYLNSDFYNLAFGQADTSYLLESDVDNSAATTRYSTNNYACENTKDKVYLPSFKDLVNADYGFPTNEYSCSERLGSPTDYAKANNCRANSNDNAEYWTRSPVNHNGSSVSYIYHDGSATSSYAVGYYKTTFYVGNDKLTAEYFSDSVGVRPAITIELDSVMPM